MDCHNSDHRSCASDVCTCGKCGKLVEDGESCTWNEDCLSGWCNGVITVGCFGRCKSKLKDHEPCTNYPTKCASGLCEHVGSISNSVNWVNYYRYGMLENYCKPTQGFREDFFCNQDADCDQTRSMMCTGGSILTTGRCTACPAHCPDGCNALFDLPENLKCGRKTTLDHAVETAKNLAEPMAEFFECMVDGSMSACGEDALKGFKNCLSGNCVVKFGGADSECLAVTKELNYTKTFGYLSMMGSVGLNMGLEVIANLNIGNEMSFTIGVHGKVSLNAKAEIAVSRNKSVHREHRYELTTPVSLIQKMYMAGALPIIIVVRVTTVAYVEFEADAEAAGNLSISYTNDEALEIKAARITFSPKNGTLTPEIDFAKNLHTNIVPELTISAAVSLKGTVRVGPELEVEVNGVPFQFFPSAHFELTGKLSVLNSCLSGSIVGGVGLYSGMGAGIPAWAESPGSLIDQACTTGLAIACQAGKGINCAVKAATKEDMCKTAKDKCSKLAKEVDVLIPGLKKPSVAYLSVPVVEVKRSVLLEFATSSCKPATTADASSPELYGNMHAEASNEDKSDTPSDLDYVLHVLDEVIRDSKRSEKEIC